MTTLELTKSKTEAELIQDMIYTEDLNIWTCCNGYHADSDIDMVGGMAIPVCPVTGEIV
tara:strand:- start:29 stop:205 length:177 start_codon:yes stop_codon:yes gene_type:complete